MTYHSWLGVVNRCRAFRFVLVCLLIAPIPLKANGNQSYVNFTFDQVDVRTFVKLVGEISGRRFVVDDDIDGKITVVSPRVKKDDVYPLFVTILESVGCSIVKEDKVYRVVKLASRLNRFGIVVGADEAVPAEGIVTKVIRLEHVSAFELRKVLVMNAEKDAISGIGAVDETNHLIITDTAHNIQRIEKIISEIDKPGLARTMEVVPLEFASAMDVAEQLNRAMSEDESRADNLRRRLAQRGSGSVGGATVAAVPAPHSNSIILVGTLSKIQSLRDLISKMDIDTPSGRGRLNAIFINYISAEEASKSLNALLARGDKKKENDVDRRIAIEAVPSSNALMVDASPGDFEVVRRLIIQLDQPPKQVHIGVLIAEVSNSDGFDFGIDFTALDMPSDSDSTVVRGASTTRSGGASSLMDSVQSGVFPRGLSVGVARSRGTDSDGNTILGYPGLINIDALKTLGNFRVKSETSLQAQNNKEATVSVVNEIPILESTIQGGSGTSRDVIQNIKRLDVGIKLKITPHVLPDEKIRLELNPSIEAVIDSGPQGTLFAPTIAKREVHTTVTVENGRTVVIAGLTREDERKTVRRVPILSSIPLLGWLFKSKSTSIERTDMLIFVTPQLVSASSSAQLLKENWEDKTGLIYEEQRTTKQVN